MSEFLDDLITVLEVAGVGTRNVSLFKSSTARIPNAKNEGPFITLVETGGSGPEGTHNAGMLAYIRPNAQIVTRGKLWSATIGMSKAAWLVLTQTGMRSQYINGVWYRSIVPLQQPFDLGVEDGTGRIMFVFNIAAVKRLTPQMSAGINPPILFPPNQTIFRANNIALQIAWSNYYPGGNLGLTTVNGSTPIITVNEDTGTDTVNGVFVLGTPIDDERVPLKAVLSSVSISFDWTAHGENRAAEIGAFWDPRNACPIGDSSGHFSETYPADYYFGGTERARLFDPNGAGFGWDVNLIGPYAGPSVHSFTVSNFQAVVQWTVADAPPWVQRGWIQL